MLFFVQVWENDLVQQPIQQRVQAPSEGHAVYY
jgi:hypothetical protein